MIKNTLILCIALFVTTIQAQTEPRFTSFSTGEAFTAITVNKQTKEVWAGTNQNGIFHLKTDVETLPENFVQFTAAGASPDLSRIRVKDMASDQLGNIWIAHEGVNFSGGIGGLERINTNGNIKHYSPDRNALGFQFFGRDGLGGLRLSSVAVDKFDRVWTVNRNHNLTSGSTFILTPGAISYKDPDQNKFTTIGAWFDSNGIKAVQPNELPYPAYTLNPGPTDNPQSRNMQAISTDQTSVWIGCWQYVPKDNVSTIIPNRVIQYDIDKNTPPVVHTFQQMKFPPGGIINGICANGNKGTWVTTSLTGKGFSVYKDGVWNYFGRFSSDSSNGNGFAQVLPENTKFNNNAIWKDKLGRVFMGTNNGLIVYNGYGPVDIQTSYKIYTNYDYGATAGNEQNIFDIEMLSNNITGGSEDPNNASRSWIATDNGIIKLFLAPEGMQLFHVRDHFSYNDSTKDTEDNVGLLTQLKNTITDGLAVSSETPSIAADGSKSTVFRFKTNDPAGYYNLGNEPYKLYVGPGPYTEIFKEEYIKQYGYFFLKSLDSYEGSPQSPEDLDYVEFTYQHPEYIASNDYKTDENYAVFDFKIVDIRDSNNIINLFNHPVKIAVPPILLGHGVWSSTASLDSMDNFFVSKNFDSFLITKAWRTDDTAAENSFSEDANIIPEYINKLKKQAADNMFSAGKVNVIVHSRGGLYTRAYIENLEPSYSYRDDINSLITLNTPHAGSQAANLVMDKRIVRLSRLANAVKYLPPPFSTLNALGFEAEDKSLGELISTIGFPPEKDRKKNNGAKNLLVVSDFLSGISSNENPNFIERLNQSSNRIKLEGIPIHAIATTFKTCEASPIYCNDIIGTIGDVIDPDGAPDDIKKKLPKAFIRAVWIYHAFEFLTGTIPESIDDITGYLYRKSLDESAESDLIVPLSSMEAGLKGNFVSNFPTENLAHIDLGFLASGESGVTEAPIVHNKLFELLRENVNDESSSSSFTKNGLNPEPLPYLFLAGWFGDIDNGSKKASEITSKIFINKDPNVFTNNIVEEDILNFSIYTEDIDKIMVVYENENTEEDVIYEIRETTTFENNMEYRVPNGFSGKTILTANGYQNGKLKTIDSIHFTVNTPATTVLQNIKFKQRNPIILNKDNYSYDLIGVYSDGVERNITENENVTYTTEDATMISQVDNTTIKGEALGSTLFTASINGLEDTILVTIEKNTALSRTILTNFYSQLSEDNSSINIFWNTLREYENETFVLETSYGSPDNFIEVNSQPGNGTSTIPAEFTFEDNSYGDNEIIFYRLKMIDTNGFETFSSAIEVSRALLSNNENTIISNNSITLFPNPSGTGNVKLSFSSSFIDQNAKIELYSIQGKRLSSQPFSILSGKNEYNLKLSDSLNSGVYLVKLTTSGYIKTMRLVINRKK